MRRKGGGKPSKKLDANGLAEAIEKLLKDNSATKKTRAAVLKALAQSAGVTVEPAGKVSLPKLKSDVSDAA